jgi:hypothetical protein
MAENPMESSAAARIANIGAGERRKRLVVGIAALSAGVIMAVLLVAVGAPLVWRLPLVFLFYVGALGFFQSRDKT